jgi:hypothetical protein
VYHISVSKTLRITRSQHNTTPGVRFKWAKKRKAPFFSDVLHSMVVVRNSEIRNDPNRMSEYIGKRTTSSFWRKGSGLEHPVSLFARVSGTFAIEGARMADFEPERSQLD